MGTSKGIFPLADGTVYSRRKNFCPFSTPPLEVYASILGEERIERLQKVARRLKELKLVELNATAQGGGVAEVAIAVAEAGADAISLINTLKGMVIDITKRRPLLGSITGGLSGPAIKPVALYMVYEVASAVELVVIGCGGITTASDAIEFIMAGASAIQVGTASFTNPRAPLDVLEGIEQFMEKEKIKDIAELIGVARR